MKKNKITRAIALSVKVGMLAFVSQTGHTSIVGSAVPNGDGTVTYSYIVDNTAGSFDVSFWSLNFEFLAPDWNQSDVLSGGDVQVPNANWFADIGVPVSGVSAQDFLSLNPAGDVPVGQNLSGFSFRSHYLPGQIAFLEFSAAGAASGGTTIGPAFLSVPDGGVTSAGFMLVAVGVLAAAGRVQRARA